MFTLPPQAAKTGSFPGWGTLRILSSRERSPGTGASWRDWGGRVSWLPVSAFFLTPT